MRLIDADALYKDVTTSIDYCEDILEIIDRQPPAEPKKGKWIKNYEDKDLYTAWWYECSECECEPVNGMLTAFCPNCGADMRGEEDEAD